MDNRNKITDDTNLQEILNDDSFIPEDVDTKNTASEDVTTIAPEDDNELVPVPEPTPEPDLDYKRKFQDSASEATTLHFKNQQMQNKIDEAANLPEPSLAELKVYAISKGAVYEELDEFAQNMLKDSYRTARQFSLIKEASDASKEIDTWAKEVDKFANTPEILVKYPSLVDNEPAFKKHCMKKNRRGMELEDLVTSFLFTLQGDAPRKVPPKKKGAMLLEGGGGGSSIPKPKELSAEDLSVIRTKDPARYKRLVKEGKAGLGLLDRE